MKKIHEDKFKIYYENTDSSGFAYHTAYLSMAERARSNMLNKDFSELITFYTGNSFTSLNLIQTIKKDGADISKIDVQLVWIDGIKSKPIKIPRNIIDRFKSMEIV